MVSKLSAELIGTFWLVLGGCGSAVLAAGFPDVGIGLLGVSLAFGLTVVTGAYALGPISGGHFNPAVSVGLWAGGRFPAALLLPYIVAQVIGGALGAGVLYLIASGQAGFSLAGGFASNGYDMHSPGKYSMMAGLVSEVVMTFMFLIIILGTTHKRAPVGFAGLAIGLGLTLIHLISIPVTNTSVNPARSTATALFVGGWALQQLWLFWIAPIIGAALAGRRLQGGSGRSGRGTSSHRTHPRLVALHPARGRGPARHPPRAVDIGPPAVLGLIMHVGLRRFGIEAPTTLPARREEESMQHGAWRWTVKRSRRLVTAAFVAAMVMARVDAGAQPAPAPAASAPTSIECGAAAGDRKTCAADTSSGRRAGPPGGRGQLRARQDLGLRRDGGLGRRRLSCARSRLPTIVPPCPARPLPAPARSARRIPLPAWRSSVVRPGACWVGPGATTVTGIWVSDGCQGTFVLTTRGGCGLRVGWRATALRRRHVRRSRARALDRSAIAACVLGDSWGYDATGVWVDKGCRAEFVLGNPHPGGPENTDLDAFFGLFEPYGRLRGHVAVFNDEVEVQDDASFLGLNFSTRGKVKFFATTEWGVSLVRGGQVFNAGATHQRRRLPQPGRSAGGPGVR